MNVRNNKQKAAEVAVEQGFGFLATTTALGSISRHWPAGIKAINWADQYFIGATNFFGALTTGAAEAAHAYANGVKISVTNIAKKVATKVVAAEIVDLAYVGINSAFGRNVDDMYNGERAVVATSAVSLLDAGLRFAGEKAAKKGFFNKCIRNNNNNNNLDNLDASLLENGQVPSSPKGPGQ